MRISSIRWGIIWIGIGFLFLAINFEVLDNLVFPTLFSLWPVLLIAIGVELIFRKTRLYFLALLSPLLIAAAFVFATVYGGGYSWSFNEFWRDWSWGYEGRKPFSEIIPLGDSVNTLHLQMDLSDTEFDFRKSGEREFSVESFFLKRSPELSLKSEGTDVYIDYTIREKGRSSIFKLAGRDLINEFRIPEDVLLYADIDTKANRCSFDFTAYRVKKLRLKANCRKVTLLTGELDDNAEAEIKGEVDNLILVQPENTGLEIVYENSGINFRGDLINLQKGSNKLKSSNFDQAENKLSVNIGARVKSVEITRN